MSDCIKNHERGRNGAKWLRVNFGDSWMLLNNVIVECSTVNYEVFFAGNIVVDTLNRYIPYECIWVYDCDSYEWIHDITKLLGDEFDKFL